MVPRCFHNAPIALAILTAITMSACGQSPSSAPAAKTPTASDPEASGWFHTYNQRLVIKFLQRVADARQVTDIKDSDVIGDTTTFTATAKVLKPGSMFWPQYVQQKWEGTITEMGPGFIPEISPHQLIYFRVKGRYLDAIPGQQAGPGPFVEKRIGLM